MAASVRTVLAAVTLAFAKLPTVEAVSASFGALASAFTVLLGAWATWARATVAAPNA